ncbi:MAG: hypothetical protein JWO36_1771 [Myxococcales bacterium]|nr:hypothetical protein [Myxococcales bacterium]
MPAHQIEPFDVRRLLFGEAPVVFLLEVVVRAVLIYVVLLTATRLMGRRITAQLSVLELTVLVTLAAAIGVPLQAPDRGLIPGALILAIAVIYMRTLFFLSFKRERASILLEGATGIVVRDGLMELRELKLATLSHERLYHLLRQHRVVHLGQIKRAYLEANGGVNAYPDEPPRPGLCVLPESDRLMFEQQFAASGQFACSHCGRVVDSRDKPEAQCPRCDACTWRPAVVATDLHKLR